MAMFLSCVSRSQLRRELSEFSKAGCKLCRRDVNVSVRNSCTRRSNGKLFRKAVTKSRTLDTLTRRFLETAAGDGQTQERPKASSTIDEEDIKRFSALANYWWKENGEFEALHTMNELRIPLIRDALKVPATEGERSQRSLPLRGVKILDVGSGGGILAEPLARLGAFVIGVDASEKNIQVAQTHATQDPQVLRNVKYIHGSVEDLVGTEEGSFDGVLASEIIEHVFNAPEFITSCCKLVKPGGSLFLTTINKTYISYMLAVVAAENVFHLVPRGTHEWDKFVSPSDLQYQLSQNGMTTKLVHGMCYNPLSRRWSWIGDVNVNYAVHAVRQRDKQTDSATEHAERMATQERSGKGV